MADDLNIDFIYYSLPISLSGERRFQFDSVANFGAVISRPHQGR
jgi:hypothetical protein